MRLYTFFITGLLMFMIGTLPTQAKQIVGLYEKVQLPDIDNLTIKAKLDTGALTSSFGASDIQFFDKEGEQWVRFKPQIAGQDQAMVEKPMVRYSKIKTRSDDVRDEEDKLHSSRPVVILDICFNGVVYPVEVNLTDRARFTYSLLLGSSALVKFKAIIDPSLKFQSSVTECKR